MIKKLDINSPIVIGGVGGSGTRLFASILKESGFYIGNICNKALDNIWFSRLITLKINEVIDSPILLKNMFNIFKIIMTSDKTISMKKFEEKIKQVGEEKAKYINPRRIYRHQLPNKISLDRWGWKEPNSHLFLAEIFNQFPDFKYIHTIRNGLDMVFSDNQNQFNKLKHLYNIPNIDTPSNRLEYWIKANKKAIELGEKLLRENFYLLNFDNFVLNKKDELKKMLTFLEIKTSEKEFNLLVSLIKKPSSIGRYKSFGTHFFSNHQLKEVNNLGFKL